MRPITNPPVREDRAGSGKFGAPRGSRPHNGIDFECTPGGLVFAPVTGEVTKIGYCYSDNLSWRYVQITDRNDSDHRLFYVSAGVSVGDNVRTGDVVGEAQDISQRYPDQGMTPHIHYEVRDRNGTYWDPFKQANK